MIRMSNISESEDTKLILLLEKIKKNGYKKALEDFLKKYPEYKYRFDKKEGSVAFRCINRNNKKCLIINSDLGNIPDFFSEVFEKIVSIDIPKKILIQKERFELKKKSNIFFDEYKFGQMPEIEKNFDLIIVNNIKIQNCKEFSRINVKKFLNNLKEHLNENACLCIAIKNKDGIRITKDKNNEKLFVDNFDGYHSLLNSLELKIEPYWVLPSHTQPHYSAKLTDDVSLKWFFENFDKKFSVDQKFKIAGKFLKLLNKNTRKYIVIKFCPSFLFYCYKNETIKSLEKMIQTNTKFHSMIQNSRMTKVLYFLLGNNGEPKKVLTCKNTKYDLNEKITFVEKKFPNMVNPDEKLILEEWLKGNFLDRLNLKYVKLAIEWLIQFQNSTTSDFLNSDEIEEEICIVKEKLKKIDAMKDLPYNTWLEDYKEEVKKGKLVKTGVHGDFQLRNILIDDDSNRVNIIDWDWRFQEKGNPIYDFIWLATSIMMYSNNPEKEISDYYNDNGKMVISVNMIKEMMNDHFKVNFNFLKLQRFMIMRFITIIVKNDDDGYLLYVNILKLLSKIPIN